MRVASHPRFSPIWVFTQPAIYYSVKLVSAVVALLTKLPDRIAFNYPTPEPFLFICLLGVNIAPSKGAPAFLTKPSLLAIGVLAVFLNIVSRAIQTVFF